MRPCPIGKANMRIRRQSKSLSLSTGYARSDSGIYLVELLVAVFISSLLAAALAENMSETFRLTSSGQNQIIAAAIGQELVDNARNTTYFHQDASVPNLCHMLGSHSLQVNQANSSTSPVNTRPLMLDLTNLDWTDDADDNKFVGTVQEVISDAGWGSYVDPALGPIPNGMRVDITVSWAERNMNKTYSLTTFISRNGIHNN